MSDTIRLSGITAKIGGPVIAETQKYEEAVKKDKGLLLRSRRFKYAFTPKGSIDSGQRRKINGIRFEAGNIKIDLSSRYEKIEIELTKDFDYVRSWVDGEEINAEKVQASPFRAYGKNGFVIPEKRPPQ